MKKTPSYRKKSVRSSNSKIRHYAMVRIDGNDVMLGDWNSPSSKEKYQRVVAEWLSNNALPNRNDERITVMEICIDYTKECNKRYLLPSGKHSSEFDTAKRVMRDLRRLFGSTNADEFKAIRFKTIRDEFVRQGLSRYVCNKYSRHVIRAFKLASENEKLPPENYLSMRSVESLKKGKTNAHETTPILPVDVGIVDTTLQHLNSIVGDMVRIQLLTGMRPGEVCQLKPVDIDRSDNIWVFKPKQHKNEHRGHSRAVCLGEQAQVILRPYLVRAADSYCFVPVEATDEMRVRRNNARVTADGRGNCVGDNRKSNPKIRPGGQYSTASYRRAIHRACDASGIERWSPNRLRKTAGTNIRKVTGSLEDAQAVLGHKSKSTTEKFYASLDLDRAIEVMKKIG